MASFLFQSLNREFILLDYLTNKQEYVKNCENKDKPSLHCNGSCQFMKKMNRKNQKESPLASLKINYEIAFIPGANHKIRQIESRQNINIFSIITWKDHLLSRSIFHPPTV
ncbi:MAG: hypothetical protein ABI844_06750 [Saprospiraceae bacterium]